MNDNKSKCIQFTSYFIGRGSYFSRNFTQFIDTHIFPLSIHADFNYPQSKVPNILMSQCLISLCPPQNHQLMIISFFLHLSHIMHVYGKVKIW